MSSGGDRLITLVTVRSKVLQCSLWKGITIEMLGKFAKYSFNLQLEIKNVFYCGQLEYADNYLINPLRKYDEIHSSSS